MCWNEHVSLNTFLFSGFVLTLIIYNNAYTQYKIHELNNIWIYIFMASFIFMQLIEYFIWKNINNKMYNHIFSVIAVLLLLVQPMASLMILTDTYLRNILLLIYLVLAIPYSIYKFSTENVHSVVSKSGHLKWMFLNLSPLDLMAWMFFFLFSLFYEKKWIGVLFGVFTLIMSYFNYSRDQTVGSMWCWSVNSAMLYYAFYLLLYLPFMEKSKICV